MHRGEQGAGMPAPGAVLLTLRTSVSSRPAIRQSMHRGAEQCRYPWGKTVRDGFLIFTPDGRSSVPGSYQVLQGGVRGSIGVEAVSLRLIPHFANKTTM